MIRGPESLKPFFEPRVVAVIGASDVPTKFGNVIFRNFLKLGFRGRVYPVNPKYGEILGHKCYASVGDVPEPVDLAVIAVPAPIVLGVMKECVEKGVKGVVIISGGFKETGPEGLEREKQLTRIAKESGIRIVGPNCVGVYDTASMVDTLFLPEERSGRPVRGSISFVSQSGAFAVAILDWMAHEGLGISKCISYGNCCDVDEADLIEYLAEDSLTKVIVLYIEGVTDGRKFIRIAKKAMVGKPIVVVKAGRFKRGASAVLSHTGMLAGSDKIYDAAFKQAGVIRAEGFEDVFDMAKSLSMQPVALGNRMLIVTDGGGAGVMTVDACETYGLDVPELPGDIQGELRKHYPAHFSTRNPIDLTGDVEDLSYRIALEEAFLKHDGVDGAIVCLLPQVPLLTFKVIDMIDEVGKKSKRPLVACCMGGEFTVRVVDEIEKRGIPAFPTPERAVRGMWALVKYGEALRKRGVLGDGKGGFRSD